MKAAEIRQKFLDFFENKGHQIVPSAPMVVKNDPTLMFTNAGMNQFKDYFLDNKKAEQQRVADTQKCLRVSGKHNDLEEVGHDTYHHTMFEMLGNWSFGDYFKVEAIEWAWDLLTNGYGLPKDRLYATIFEGDFDEGLERDVDAFVEWKKYLPEDRILDGNKKDNFWEMGDTGPCGPCSEIHIDLRPDEERAEVDGKTLVNMDHPQVVEIWNLVFMQYNRMSNGSLKPLPEQHVDTGMGFERLCMAIQQKTSNYDTDVFTPLINQVAAKANVKYGDEEKIDIALRVISDHVRAVSFAIADGQLPSNNGAGYVIRRILRRGIRYGYSYLHLEEPFIFDMVPTLAEQMKDVFPELIQQLDFVQKVIEEEETSFLRTLSKGIDRFEKIDGDVTGEIAFELYDTYGFPIDLTQLLATEKGTKVDMEEFKECLEAQKNRSRKASEVSADDWVVVNEDDREEFVGYDYLNTEVKITRYRKVVSKKKEQYQLVFNLTPFYAESGGQVGDKGYIEFNGEKVSILDTQKENDLIIHLVDKLPSTLEYPFKAFVSEQKRKATTNNHSATHLLHAALKQVLGDHVQQKGSLVNPEGLRFDFSHFSKVEEEQIHEIESIVNSKIREGIALDEKRSVPIEKAKEMGATALFGEKYGDTVRVISFDSSFSMELCGGTHVANTAQIGMFKIISESSISAGVRRIEAITAEKAESYVNKQLVELKEIQAILKNPKNSIQAIDSIITENSKLKKKIEILELGQVKGIKDALIGKAIKENGMTSIQEKISIPSANALKQLAFDLRKEIDDLFLILAAEVEGKPQIVIMLSDSVKAKGFNASEMIKILGKEIKGGGGGQDFFATAGGKDISGLDRVVEKSKELLASI